MVMDDRMKGMWASGDREEPGGHKGLVAIEGRVYIRPCRT